MVFTQDPSTDHRSQNDVFSQELPWPDQPLRYYKKYRVYFTEYRPGYHKNIFRQDMGIGASDGSDVPQTVSPTKPRLVLC